MKVWIEEDTLTGIADAIRSKKGTSGLIPTPNMKNEILSISGGGEGHREVSSILTDGASYINTNINPNPNYSIEMRFKLTEEGLTTGKFDHIYGTRNGSYSRMAARFDANTGVFVAQRSADSVTSSASAEWSDDYSATRSDYAEYRTFKLLKNELYIDDVLKYTFATSNNTAHYLYPLYLFCVNEKDAGLDLANCARIELQYVKLWNDKDELLLDLIPVVKNDGTVCMYNKVNGAYYYNAGTGTFTYSE